MVVGQWLAGEFTLNPCLTACHQRVAPHLPLPGTNTLEMHQPMSPSQAAVPPAVLVHRCSQGVTTSASYILSESQRSILTNVMKIIT